MTTQSQGAKGAGTETKADPKKKVDGLSTRVVRDILRGVLPRK